MLKRVTHTSILGQGDIIVVDSSGSVITEVLNVLNESTVLDSIEDFWLLLSSKADSLSVAAALNVKDTSVTPNVLIISDQCTVWISTQGSLSSSGETKEQTSISVFAFVGRAVH